MVFLVVIELNKSNYICLRFYDEFCGRLAVLHSTVNSLKTPRTSKLSIDMVTGPIDRQNNIQYHDISTSLELLQFWMKLNVRK